MIERGVKMKIVILITLFTLNLAAANRDELGRGFDPRNDVERPIFPFEAFNMGFENFLRKIHPPLLAAMNRGDLSADETRSDPSDVLDNRNTASVPSSSSEHGSREEKSRFSQTVESKDTAESHLRSSPSTSSSESEDSMSRSILEALDRDSLSTVDLSEFSIPDRQSPMGVKADRPLAESRSRHDSLEFVDKQETRSGDGDPEEQQAAGSADDSPMMESSGTRELESLAVGSGEPSLGSRRPEGSETVELSESESISVGSGVASNAESFLGETGSGRDYLKDFEDVPLEEACYNEALVAGLGDFEGEGFEDGTPPEPPKDVRKWEKVRQELSVTNVRKRLEEAVSHLEDIKKRSMRRGDNLLGDLNHVISDLEFLCDTICQEVPKDYLNSASDSFY